MRRASGRARAVGKSHPRELEAAGESAELLDGRAQHRIVGYSLRHARLAYASHADRRLQDLGEVLLELGSALLLPEQPRELLAESNDYGRAIDGERLGLRELRGFADASLLRAFDELAPGFADRLQLHDRRSRASRDRRLGDDAALRDGDDR